jgi:hypothetical protein
MRSFSAVKRSFVAGLWMISMVVLVAAVGCGPRSKPTASVKGKVTAKGQAVTGGGITFSPIAVGNETSPGRPAAAVIQSDGTFVLSTEKEGDGAVIGRHRVTFSQPSSNAPPQEWDGTGTPPENPKSPYEGMVPKPAEVEVKAGANDITIELVEANDAGAPPTAGPPPTEGAPKAEGQ